MDEIAASCFERGRVALKGWIAKHADMFPDDDLAELFVDPKEFGLHRLGGGGMVMGDNCAQANRLKTLLCDKIAEACAGHYGDAWESFDDAKRAATAACHEADCWNHLRNTWFAGAAQAMGQVVKDSLSDDSR